LAKQRWQLFQHLKMNYDFEREELREESREEPGEAIFIDPKQMAKEKARSLGLLTGKSGAPVMMVSKASIQKELLRLEEELIAARSKHRALVDEARVEEDLRLYNDEQGRVDPEVIQRAVLAGIRASRQRQKTEEIELRYLTMKEKNQRWEERAVAAIPTTRERIARM
jgi:hypothetical protein